MSSSIAHKARGRLAVDGACPPRRGQIKPAGGIGGGSRRRVKIESGAGAPRTAPRPRTYDERESIAT